MDVHSAHFNYVDNLKFYFITIYQIRAKNQLRVNGLSFGMYYGTFFTVLVGMMLYVLIALLACVQVYRLECFIYIPYVYNYNIAKLSVYMSY